ncbi:MAG: tetratricopeptide repeat protein [Deltaproteobacteria bacterium]|nr:tetratricopeptide repeat protein [Deltaproteobacteria bacterium]
MRNRVFILIAIIFSLAVLAGPPQPASAFSKSLQNKKAEASPSFSPKKGTEAVKVAEGGVKEIITFNEGWRWVYRKKVTSILRGELYTEDRLLESVFAQAGIHAPGMATTINAAGALADELGQKGYVKKAALLKDIIAFLAAPKDPNGLDAVLRESGEAEFKKLGFFVLANYYENRGFFPEASGYFSKVIADKKDSAFLPAAQFGRARILFLDGKLNSSREFFQSSFDRGFGESRLWLANAALTRGEFDIARKLYDGNKTPLEEMDSINLLAAGDMYVLSGSRDEARKAYGILRSRYPNDELLSTYFTLKTGDSYLAEGNRDEAIKVYSKAKEALKGEPWAVSALSLADLLQMEGSNDESLVKAVRIYAAVADGGYLGSEAADLSLISLLTRLDRFEEAMERLKGFPGKYPMTTHKAELSRLQGALVNRWIDTLYSRGDYNGAISVSSAYGSAVPFGKKAESFLKSGKAYYSLGLYPDAVKYLDRSIKIGVGDVAEDAMVTIAKVYLSQSDTGSAERLLNAFVARFPKTRYQDEVDGIAFRIAMMKNDFKKASGMRTPPGAEFDLLKADAFSKTERHGEAATFYARAAKALEAGTDNGDKGRLSRAYAGLGDSNFASGRFEDAIRAYRMLIRSSDNKDDRAWALYRIAQGCAKLDDGPEKQKALKELKELNTELGGWAGEIFKDPAKL